MNEAEVDRLIQMFRDPGLSRLLRPYGAWEYREDAYHCVLEHLPSGSEVIRKRDRVRWWPRQQQGIALKGPRGGFRDFRYPSRAVAALQEGGHLEPPLRLPR